MIDRRGAELYAGFRDDLVLVHGELRVLASAAHAAVVAESVRTPLVKQSAERLIDRLDRHHRAEDVFFFPAFRAAGRLSSSDADFLDECDDEHRDIVALSAAVQRDLEFDPGSSAPDVRRWAGRLAAQLSELSLIVGAHFDVEEAGLTVELLEHAVRPREMREIYADMEAHWRTR